MLHRQNAMFSLAKLCHQTHVFQIISDIWQRQRDRNRDIDRETETERNRDKEKETDRHTETESLDT